MIVVLSCREMAARRGSMNGRGDQEASKASRPVSLLSLHPLTALGRGQKAVTESNVSQRTIYPSLECSSRRNPFPS